MFGLLASVTEIALMMLEPVYQTYKGLEANETGGNGLDQDVWRRLLVHWIVYGVFRAVEGLARPWVPFYDLVKIGAIVWLRAGGSDTVYQMIIRPYLAENEQAIDEWIDQMNRTRETVMAATSVLSAAVTADPDAFDEGVMPAQTTVLPDPVVPTIPAPVSAKPDEGQNRKDE
ncbi:receptor expression-enhancing protein 5-like [Melanaphis sacchari]|uniref:receptor expression-enhancing protein 5-like n=1 Tax=Melanaphis sacchari TaxID=742174 RepID=UPI000DC1434A|nr:receptor expression-enhancing protein 5-like [Melanaphis sacchari]